MSLVVEIFNKSLELTGRQAVEGVECNRGTARRLRGHALAIGIARGQGKRNGEQAGDTQNSPRAAHAVAPTLLHTHRCGRAFCSLNPSGQGKP